MICYKKINLECLDNLQTYLVNQISKILPEGKVTKVISKNIILPDELLTTVNAELNSYNIPDIEYCRIYLWPKRGIQKPHVDGSGIVLHCSINIPLHGGENSTFRWLGGDYTLTPIDLVETNQKAYAIKWQSTPAIIESVELVNGCYLIRIDQPHQAIASADSDRWVFTMRFKGNPTFEELYDKLPVSNL